MNDKQKKVMELRDFLESIDGINGIRIYGYIPLAEYLQEEGFRREKDTAREILQILHNIGGCDATDEWSKGYDAAIDTAYKEIAKRFGVEVEG